MTGAADARMRGIFPILVTPFDERERVDEDGLRAVVEFNLEAGVHGLGIALASEIGKLTEAERERVIEVVVGQVRGRVPVVVNSGAPASFTAALFSRQAEQGGAAAVMCLPPAPASASEIRAYFKAVSDAVRVPVFVQDTAAAPVPAGLIRRIADECERVRYAKVESAPPASQVLAAVEAGGERVSVFGGAGGAYLIEELRRGAVGTMPWPSQPDVFVAIWDRWQSGDERGASALHEREIAPLARFAAGGPRLSHAIHKELLRRRGVIRNAALRAPADPLDPLTRRELDELCERLAIG
jgi:dihydrodipicolinate synthase/N-acetylneuraminate lyase